MSKIDDMRRDIVTLIDGTKLRIKDISEALSWNKNSEVTLQKVDHLFWPIELINLDNGKSIRTRYWYKDDLVPKGKFDFDTVSELEKASMEDVIPILPDLFEWTEDVNWPIAPKLSEVLSKFGEAVIPYIKHYLKHPAGLDEYGTYFFLMPKLSKEQLELIRDDLIQIWKNPTEFQKEEEYDKLAAEYIEKLDNNYK